MGSSCESWYKMQQLKHKFQFVSFLDKAAPIGSIMHTFFNEIVLSIGGKKISSNSGFNAQIFSIMNRVGLSQTTKSTIQYIEGRAFFSF